MVFEGEPFHIVGETIYAHVLEIDANNRIKSNISSIEQIIGKIFSEFTRNKKIQQITFSMIGTKEAILAGETANKINIMDFQLWSKVVEKANLQSPPLFPAVGAVIKVIVQKAVEIADTIDKNITIGIIAPASMGVDEAVRSVTQRLMDLEAKVMPEAIAKK